MLKGMVSWEEDIVDQHDESVKNENDKKNVGEMYVGAKNVGEKNVGENKKMDDSDEFHAHDNHVFQKSLVYLMMMMISIENCSIEMDEYVT